jgi:hypothetical protein
MTSTFAVRAPDKGRANEPSGIKFHPRQVTLDHFVMVRIYARQVVQAKALMEDHKSGQKAVCPVCAQISDSPGIAIATRFPAASPVSNESYSVSAFQLSRCISDFALS